MNPLLPELFDLQGFFNRKRIKVRNHLYQWFRTFVVELGGIEPPSESTLTRTSPGADGYLGVKPIPSLGRKPSRVPIR